MMYGKAVRHLARQDGRAFLSKSLWELYSDPKVFLLSEAFGAPAKTIVADVVREMATMEIEPYRSND